jgi:hypothetical protein
MRVPQLLMVENGEEPLATKAITQVEERLITKVYYS